VKDGVSVKGRLLPVDQLSDRQRDTMCHLMGTTFLGVTRELFEEVLLDKEYAILRTDPQGKLRGFTCFA